MSCAPASHYLAITGTLCRHTATSLFVCMALAGCVVPTFPAFDRQQATNRQDAFDRLSDVVVPGQTTKADVLSRLGEPDRRGIGDRWFLYQWTNKQVGAIVGFPLPVLIQVTPRSAKAIVIDFDDGGIVSSAANAAYNRTCFGLGERDGEYYCTGQDEYLNWRRLLDRDRVDTTAGALVEADEGVLEAFAIAAYHDGDHWVDGAAVVTNRALVFLDRLGPDMPFSHPRLRLARKDIVSARLDSDVDASTGPVAVLDMTDGTSTTLAFGRLTDAAARPPFDAARTRLVVETVSLMLERR